MNNSFDTNLRPTLPCFDKLFGDKRLSKRCTSLFSKLSSSPSSSIRRISSSRSEQKAYYRLLNNDKLKESILIKELTGRVSSLGAGRHVLCLQDTCEINLSNHSGRLQQNTGLGRSDNAGTAHCFKLHPSLVLDAQSHIPLGFSGLKLWHRAMDGDDRFARNYKRAPIQEKESYKWIDVANQSKESLALAESITFIEDREGDIFEQFALIPNHKTHLLIRSRTSRKLLDGSDLYEKVASMPLAGKYTITLPTDIRKNQKKTNIEVGLKYCSASIQRPDSLPKNLYPKSIKVNLIEVKEMGHGSKPRVHWRLLTTHDITCFESALKLVEWYSARWFIEQVFRLLKRKGFGIEQVELESGWAIRRLAILQLSAALKIIQMNIAYNDPEQGQPIEEVFDKQQIKALKLLNNKLQGKTKKLQNHNDSIKLKWATWVIARLGGWKGYDSLGPPGVIVLKRGLDRLGYVIEGMRLVEDVGTQ